MSEETKDTSGGEKDARQKRLTPEDWREIETHWEYDSMRTKEICEKFGITPQAVNQHMRANPHIKKGSKAHLNRAKSTAIASPPAATVTPVASSEFEAKRKERIEQTKESIYRASTANALMFGKIQKEVLDGTRTVEAAEKAFKALRQAETFLNLSRVNRYEVLDIANEINEQDLPVLVFEDLTQTEITKIQQGDGNEEELDLLDLPESPTDDDVIEEGRPE